MKIFKARFLIYIFFALLISCQQTPPKYRTQIDLSGEWQLALDSLNLGEQENWFSSDLAETVQLPGTLDENKKGRENTDITTMHLNRIYTYEGAAWYRKKVTIPENLKDKNLQLFLERTKSSTVWIDDKRVGGSHLLQSPHVFDVSNYLNSRRTQHYNPR